MEISASPIPQVGNFNSWPRASARLNAHGAPGKPEAPSDGIKGFIPSNDSDLTCKVHRHPRRDSPLVSWKVQLTSRLRQKGANEPLFHLDA